MIRSLRQPGPPHPSRIDCFRGDPQPLRYALPQGATLNHAVTTPLVAAGLQSATVTFRNLAVSPFRYVMPGPADDTTHVAYFTAPVSPAGITHIEHATATFGWIDGKPAIHCHAVWTEPDGRRRGGHIIPNETILSAAGEATAYGFRTVRIEARVDPETNFALLQPFGFGITGPGSTGFGSTRTGSTGPGSNGLGSNGLGSTGAGLVARVKPNEDILSALETIARIHAMPEATIHGSLGSLIGARFTDGGEVSDHATEVLVRQGHIRNGIAALDLLVVDMGGEVHQGWLTRGENPVCITFDIFLEARRATEA